MISSASPNRYQVTHRRDDGGWKDIGSCDLIGWDQVLELALPFKELEVGESERVQMSLLVYEHEMEIARYPRHQPVIVTVPGPDFGATVWRV
jgi:hypothetical protein